MNRDTFYFLTSVLVAAIFFTGQMLYAAQITRVDLNDNAGTDLTNNLTSVAQAGDDATDTILNNARTFIVVANDSAAVGAGSAGATVTITAQVSTVQTAFGELSVPDLQAEVEDSEDTVLIAAPRAYNDGGSVALSYTGDTSNLKVGAFELPTR